MCYRLAMDTESSQRIPIYILNFWASNVAPPSPHINIGTNAFIHIVIVIFICALNSVAKNLHFPKCEPKRIFYFLFVHPVRSFIYRFIVALFVCLLRVKRPNKQKHRILSVLWQKSVYSFRLLLLSLSLSNELTFSCMSTFTLNFANLWHFVKWNSQKLWMHFEFLRKISYFFHQRHPSWRYLSVLFRVSHLEIFLQ